MADNKFITVETSKYVPLNPGAAVPINGHFEIKIRRTQSMTDGAGDGGGDIAKPAPTVTLSNLASGDFPLFANGSEVASFATSLILNDSNWHRNYNTGSDSVKFTYLGGPKTLDGDFTLLAYSDAFNSTAEFVKKAVITVNCRDFSQQFDDAFDDNYTISATQTYAPNISHFTPKDLKPKESGGREYIVELGQEIVLSWSISGDSLKSPTLTLNGGIAETVSFDTPVKKVVDCPSIYKLSVESNAFPGVVNNQSISFDVSTGPFIAKFEASQTFCLAGSSVLLDVLATATTGCTISALNSTEKVIDVPSPSSTVLVTPVLKNPKKRTVEYVLTAGGYKGKNPAYVTATAPVTVSCWIPASAAAKPLSFSADDLAITPVRFEGGNYYCFVDQYMYESIDSVDWTKLSEFPGDGSPCQASVGIKRDRIYVVAKTADEALYLSRFDISNKSWSDAVVFGPDKRFAGGTFVFIREHEYYIAAQDRMLCFFDYSLPPFDNWGQIGRLKTADKILSMAALYKNNSLYIAVACADDCIYIYTTSEELDDPETPLKISAATSWVRLVYLNGRICALSAAGIFDILNSEQIDMMFDSAPKYIGLAVAGLTGIRANGQRWLLDA